jgi:NADH-quinone oxidoreductase subunit L
MWIPLGILAILSLVGGFFDLPHFLEPALPHAPHVEHEAWLEIVGFGGLYRLVYDKYRVDEAYDMVVVQPLIGGSRAMLWKGLDAGLIDGIVNGTGGLARMIGGLARWVQSGNIRSYGTWVVLGSVVAIAILSLSGGTR